MALKANLWDTWSTQCGEIWLGEFNPTIRNEIRKTPLVMIVSNDAGIAIATSSYVTASSVVTLDNCCYITCPHIACIPCSPCRLTQRSSSNDPLITVERAEADTL
jgi:mRNA-degrading endonuclease toxin of MazEF toxin-antitoxin module